MKSQQREAEQEHKRLKDRLVQLSDEIAKSLTGESAFTPDMLSTAIDSTKTALQATRG